MARDKDRIYWATELALKNIVEEGFDDIFISGKTKHWSNIIEHELLQYKKVQEFLLAEVRRDLMDALNDQKSKRPSCLVDYKKYQNPKRTGLYAYRQAALLEPKTTLGYLSLAILFGEAIEQRRLKIAENCVFSYRFEPNEQTGLIFSNNENLGFKGFRKEEYRQAADDENKVILTADISHFYDSLNIHVLENELRDAADEDQFLSVRVTRWLDRFLQKTDTGWSRGIPVGNNASRILAEASLISLDRRLKKEGIKFIRFVDDFRVFTKTTIDAQKALETLNFELSLLGLTLNDSKVSVRPISDEKRNTGKKLVSGQEPDIGESNYLDVIPMNYRRTKKTSKGYEEYALKVASTYSRYEAGELLVDQKDVKYLIRYILGSDTLEEKKKIVDVLGQYLTFSKYICSYCEQDDTEIELKTYVFDWFLNNIESLPNHALHALFGMASATPDLKERAVKEILMASTAKAKIDPFIYREALVLLRTKCTKDDLEDLARNIHFDIWTKRAVAYCIWRGNQFSQKVKQVHLIRISENNSDIFLKFLAQVRHADLDGAPISVINS